MRNRRSQVMTLWLLIGVIMSGCLDMDLTGLDEIDLGTDQGGLPAPPRVVAALAIKAYQAEGDTLRRAEGRFRVGNFESSLGTSWLRDESGSRVVTLLVGGWSRPGTYAVSVSAPGYVTWDTTGVVARADSDGMPVTVELVVQLQPES